MIEGVAFFLLRGRMTRVLLAAAMAMDLVPLGLFALHMARAVRYSRPIYPTSCCCSFISRWAP